MIFYNPMSFLEDIPKHIMLRILLVELLLYDFPTPFCVTGLEVQA